MCIGEVVVVRVVVREWWMMERQIGKPQSCLGCIAGELIGDVGGVVAGCRSGELVASGWAVLGLDDWADGVGRGA
ncbi:hypothetical protein Hanom_Chr01g00002361 [Helianthus anomalus]